LAAPAAAILGCDQPTPKKDDSTLRLFSRTCLELLQWAHAGSRLWRNLDARPSDVAPTGLFVDRQLCVAFEHGDFVVTLCGGGWPSLMRRHVAVRSRDSTPPTRPTRRGGVYGVAGRIQRSEATTSRDALRA